MRPGLALATLEEAVAIPLGAYTATQSTLEMRAHGARGVLCILRVKSVTSSTARVSIAGKEPFQGNFSGLNATTATVAGIGTYFYILHPNVAKQPPGEVAATSHATNVIQHVGLLLPDVFRLQVVKGDASAWEFGLAFRRLR
jgi:hypothetical protein